MSSFGRQKLRSSNGLCVVGWWAAAFVALTLGCGGASPPQVSPAPQGGRGPHGHAHEGGAHGGSRDADAEALEAVARTHGGAGPWAVAGYRMGVFALTRLGLSRGSFDLEVRHESPSEVQFSCVADGAQAATGASLGKLNLSHVVVTRAELKTTYRNKVTGERVVLRPSKAFVLRFENVPRERLGEAGREVLHLSDADVFEEVK